MEEVLVWHTMNPTKSLAQVFLCGQLAPTPRVSHVKGFILFKIEIQRVFEAYSLILQPSQRLGMGMSLWATANGI